MTGIHGRPYKAYDNVQALQGNEANGYCTHVSIIFPPWHRPYLALYEVNNPTTYMNGLLLTFSKQILYNAIQVIAQQYPEGTVRNKYVASAANFRIPYWDWAAVPPSGESVLPSSVSSSATIAVDGPRGTQNIWNPLYSYSFQPLDSTDIPDAPVSGSFQPPKAGT
jgi:tyrosinase